MKKFKITRGDRVYIVDAKSHIDAISKVKAVKDVRFLTEDMEAGNVKDSSIRDYSPEVYVNELEKLIPEYIRLDKLRDKIIESLKSSGKIDSSNWRQTDRYINDAKVQQWLKQVKELDTKWNKLLDNLSRFKGTQSYRRNTNSSDRDIWLDDVPYPREIKGIQGDIAIIGLLKGSKNKDSISQWKPGMSEIGLFQISYKKGTVNQSILVKAATKEDAINKFTKHKPDAEVIGVNEYPNPHFGEPILDSKIKDSGINYGTLFIDLNSPNELTASRIVQELKNEIGNNKIAEIRGGSFTPLREYGSAGLDLDFKEFKNNEWGTNHIRLSVRSELSLPVLMKMKDDPKSAYKLRAELNNRLKQFANKTIYSNKSFTMDSKIKDIDEYKKNYAASMRAAGEKTKRDQINSDIQKLYDIAKQYGPVRTEQNKLNNEFEQQNMQVVRNRFYNDPTVKRALKQMEDLDTKWNAIVDKYKVLRQYSIPQDGPNRFMGWNTPTKKWVDDIKKQLIKDSAIKDMPLMFKSNVNMQSLKSNIDNVKNKPNETYINSLNANVQGIIADIEEIKGYEKEGKFNESPALKLSCKNLTAQYYKLLNDPKLQGTLHKLDEPTYKNVLYAEHQAQMLSQVTLKDSSIKDYGGGFYYGCMTTQPYENKDRNELQKYRQRHYDKVWIDVRDIRKKFQNTDKRTAINTVKKDPEYTWLIRELESTDKDWNAIIDKYPRLKKFRINTTGAERLLYGYYPDVTDFIDIIEPVLKEEWYKVK